MRPKSSVRGQLRRWPALPSKKAGLPGPYRILEKAVLEQK